MPVKTVDRNLLTSQPRKLYDSIKGKHLRNAYQDYLYCSMPTEKDYLPAAPQTVRHGEDQTKFEFLFLTPKRGRNNEESVSV